MSTPPWSDAELGVDVCLLASQALDVHDSVHRYDRNDPGQSNLLVHIGAIYVHKLIQITLIWKLVCKASNPKLILVSQATVASFKCQGHISCHLNPMCSVLSSWQLSVKACRCFTLHLVSCRYFWKMMASHAQVLITVIIHLYDSLWAPHCHKPRYWSVMDQYKVTLLQRKQVQDASLWFPYKFRARRTAGNSRGHSLVQSPECGNEFNQAWESCTTTG